MLKTSIRNHDPIKLYEFLEKNVGPLRIMIRKDYAIIKFIAKIHTDRALEKFSSFRLGENTVELESYDEEKQANQKIINPEKDMIPQVPVEIKKDLSKEQTAILQGLQIKDRQNLIEKIIKQRKKDMVHYIATFDHFLQEANNKIKKYGEKYDESNQSFKKIKRIIDKRLQKIHEGIKQSFIALNADIKAIGQEKSNEINVDPELEFIQLEEKILEFKSFKPALEYLNQNNNSCIKRLAALNNNQFISSSMVEILNNNKATRTQGLLNIYDINKQMKQWSISCKEGSFGLLVLDKYVITAANHSCFNFYHQERINNQQQTPKIFNTPNEMNKFTITDILKCGERQNGYNIIALGGFKQESRIKHFYVKEYEFCTNVHSLIFEEVQQKNEPKEIKAIESIRKNSEVLLGFQHSLQMFDLNKWMDYDTIKIDSQILRIKKIDSNSAYLAQKRGISLVDLRDKSIRKYSLKADISSICVLNPNSLIYGTDKGEIGLFDIRKAGVISSNTICHKEARISDIIKHNEKVISGDQKGQIVTWKNSDL